MGSDSVFADRDKKAAVEAVVGRLAGVSDDANSIEPFFKTDDGLILGAEQNLPSRETVDALGADRVQGESELDEVFSGQDVTPKSVSISALDCDSAAAAAFRAARRLPRLVVGAGLWVVPDPLRVRVMVEPVPRRAVASLILMVIRPFMVGVTGKKAGGIRTHCPGVCDRRPSTQIVTNGLHLKDTMWAPEVKRKAHEYGDFLRLIIRYAAQVCGRRQVIGLTPTSPRTNAGEAGTYQAPIYYIIGPRLISYP